MKKTILILISTLLAVYLVLSVLGMGGEYAAERLFYRALKLNRKIIINPDVAPPGLAASVENDLRQLLKKYPKSNVAKRANMTLAEFYITNKRHGDALSTLNAIMQTYAADMTTLSAAQFLKGIVYERQNKWNNALREYTTLRDRYTDTRLGLQVPLYIAKHYSEKGSPAEAEAAYKDAAVFYEKLKNDNKGKPLGYAASNLLIQTHLRLQDYKRAGSLLAESIERYPSAVNLLQLLPYVELIFVKKLNRPEKAVEIYQDAKTKIKNEKFIKFMDKKIEGVKIQK